MAFFFFKQKTAYEMRISDWSSDVCSSDLLRDAHAALDGERFGAEIAEDDADLAAVIRIDGPGAVQHRDAVAQRQPGARPHLRLVSLRQGDAQPGRYQCPRAGHQRHRRLENGRAQV